MLFMVIERFRNRDAEAVYQRFREQGRMLPKGLKYIERGCRTKALRCNLTGKSSLRVKRIISAFPATALSRDTTQTGVWTHEQ